MGFKNKFYVYYYPESGHRGSRESKQQQISNSYKYIIKYNLPNFLSEQDCTYCKNNGEQTKTNATLSECPMV